MTPDRVVARYIQAEDLGDPKALLTPFQGAIESLDVALADAAKARELLERFLADRRANPNPTPLVFPPEVAEARKLADKAFYRLAAKVSSILDAGRKLFLAIVQKLVVAPALRKKVEKASRNYLKGVRFRSAAYGLEREIEQLKFFEKQVGMYFADLAAAKEAIVKGKEHAEEGEGATKIRVGGFTVINTGGFSKDVMDNIVEIMTKAEALAKSSGLGQVCYGEVQVTNTLSKANVLAFYLIAKDSLFIRANVKPGGDIVQTVLHELGHRYDHMFLKNKRGVERLYQIQSGEEVEYKQRLRQKRPAAGDMWTSEKGEEYKVVAVERGRKGDVVVMQKVSNPRVTGKISLEGFLEIQEAGSARDLDQPDYKGFVTPYAKSGGPGENFAEMFSFYCLSTLPVFQSVPFEALVFGGPEAATFRFARRVAARFILGAWWA